MQRRKIMNRRLKKQGVCLTDRRYLLRLIEDELDQSMQDADMKGEAKIETKVRHQKAIQKPLEDAGYTFVVKPDGLYLRRSQKNK